MEPWLVGKLLSPFALILLSLVVLIPVRNALRSRMKEGWIKRFLLSESPWLFFAVFFGFWIVMGVYMRAVGAF